MLISVHPRPEPGYPETRIVTDDDCPLDPADWLVGLMSLTHRARVELGARVPESVAECLDGAADALGDAAGALALHRHNAAFIDGASE